MFRNHHNLTLQQARSVYLFFFHSKAPQKEMEHKRLFRKRIENKVSKRARSRATPPTMHRAAKLVILTSKVENASDYCKLGVQVRLSISAGVQVERGRCANDARRILHQSNRSNFTPVWPLSLCTTDRCPTLRKNYRTTTVKQIKVTQIGSKFESKLFSNEQ